MGLLNQLPWPLCGESAGRSRVGRGKRVEGPPQESGEDRVEAWS